MVQRTSNHKFIDEDNTEYILDLATNYSLRSQNRIIIKEAATGSGAIVISNGSKVKDIPLNGFIVGNTFEEVETKRLTLQNLSDSGQIIEFISVHKPTASNKFFIRDFTAEPAHGNASKLPFSCSLIEYRTANVRTTAVNLVNFQSKEAFLAVYNQRIGNV